MDLVPFREYGWNAGSRFESELLIPVPPEVYDLAEVLLAHEYVLEIEQTPGDYVLLTVYGPDDPGDPNGRWSDVAEVLCVNLDLEVSAAVNQLIRNAYRLMFGGPDLCSNA